MVVYMDIKNNNKTKECKWLAQTNPMKEWWVWMMTQWYVTNMGCASFLVLQMLKQCVIDDDDIIRDSEYWRRYVRRFVRRWSIFPWLVIDHIAWWVINQIKAINNIVTINVWYFLKISFHEKRYDHDVWTSICLCYEHILQ